MNTIYLSISDLQLLTDFAVRSKSFDPKQYFSVINKFKEKISFSSSEISPIQTIPSKDCGIELAKIQSLETSNAALKKIIYDTEAKYRLEIQKLQELANKTPKDLQNSVLTLNSELASCKLQLQNSSQSIQKSKQEIIEESKKTLVSNVPTPQEKPTSIFKIPTPRIEIPKSQPIIPPKPIIIPKTTVISQENVPGKKVRPAYVSPGAIGVQIINIPVTVAEQIKNPEKVTNPVFIEQEKVEQENVEQEQEIVIQKQQTRLKNR